MARIGRLGLYLAGLLAVLCLGTGAGWFAYYLVLTDGFKGTPAPQSIIIQPIDEPKAGIDIKPDPIQDIVQENKPLEFDHLFSQGGFGDRFTKLHRRGSVKPEDIPTDDPAFYKHLGSTQQLRGHALDPDLLQHQRRGFNASKGPFQLPRLIHQTVPDRKKLSCQQMQLMRSWRDKNPGYRHIIWDDNDIQRFVRTYYPRLRLMFEGFVKPVERADIFRYLVLHAKGGVYADTDVQCMEPVDTWNDVNRYDAAVLTGIEFNNKKEGFQLNNWVIAAMPRHVLMMRVITEARDFITSHFFQLAKRGGSIHSSEYDKTILARTGPKAWTRAVLFYIEAILRHTTSRPLVENHLYGDVRVVSVPWLSLSWGRDCNIAVKEWHASKHAPEEGRPLACHQFFGSWKGNSYQFQHDKVQSFECKQEFEDSGPLDEDFM